MFHCDVNKIFDAIAENFIWVLIFGGGAIGGLYELYTTHAEQAATAQISVEMAKSGMEQKLVVVTNGVGGY